MREKSSKITSSGGSNTAIIIVPADIVKDSMFPFKLPAKVMVRIEEGKIVVEKAKQ